MKIFLTGGTRFTLVQLDDLAEGIALALEKGGEGDTYFLCGESKSLRETLAIWNKRPGALKQRAWLPPFLMSAMVWPIEPVQRAAGLPAVLSRQAGRRGGQQPQLPQRQGTTRTRLAVQNGRSDVAADDRMVTLNAARAQRQKPALAH